MTAGFCRRASAGDLVAIRRYGHVSPAFVTTTASRAASSYILHGGKLVSGRADLSHGLTLRPFPLPLPRRLLLQGRHPRRVLSPPPAKGGSALSIFLRRRGGVRSGMPELRLGSGAMVLYQGYEAGRKLPTRARPSHLLVPGRLLRGRSNRTQRPNPQLRPTLRGRSEIFARARSLEILEILVDTRRSSSSSPRRS
jgi:hypothetical protein